MADETEHPLGGTSFARRMIFSLVRPAAAIADGAGIGLKDFVQIAQVALCRVKKARGLTQREMAMELDVSSRTIDRVLRSMREGFFDPETAHELPRQIEFVLWTEPAGLARLVQLLPEHDEADIERALAQLEDEERVRREPGRTPKYVATRRANRLADDNLAARVDALNNVLSVVQDAVARRFLRDDASASARTVAMRARPEDLPEIEKIYEAYVWPRLVEIDARAEGCEEAVELGLTMVWSPRFDSKDPTPEE